MRQYLTFQLYGPLAAWGEQAVGQERDASPQPSRSAILGLVAAALGLRREDEQQHTQLAQALGIGIKLCARGLGMRDFHTAQRAKSIARAKHLYTRKDELAHDNIDTVISYRAYRQDSAAVVALWLAEATGDFDLEVIAQAIQQPAFNLYLGRKSCPLALPLAPRVTSAADLRSALDSHQQALQSEELLPAVLRRLFAASGSYYWDITDEPGMQADYQQRRYDQPLSRVRWQFAERQEFVRLESVEEKP
jgi:CRISPR system Cascade subunit CasD